MKQPTIVRGSGRWDAAAGKWRPGLENTCPKCGGLLSARGAAERFAIGDGPGGVGATYAVNRRCLDCSVETRQIERRDGTLDAPTAV